MTHSSLHVVEYTMKDDQAWEIDAEKCGNEMRFINYPSESETANVEGVCENNNGRQVHHTHTHY